MEDLVQDRLEEDTPKFSVVIPLYNKAPYIARCIHSVLNQTFDDCEIVVVDDGSTDCGPEIVKAMEEPRIRLFRQPNRGASCARNKGAAESRAQLVAFIDADDEWLPGFLESIMELIERYPQAGGFGTASWFLRANGMVRLSENRRALGGKFEGMVTDYFRSWPIFWCCSAVVRKEIFEQTGGFDPLLKNGQDQDLWFKVAAISAFAYTNKPQVIWHLKVAGSLSGSGSLSYRTHRIIPNSVALLSLNLPQERKDGIRQYVAKSVKLLLLGSAARGHSEYAKELLDEYVARFGSAAWSVKIVREIARSKLLSRVMLTTPKIGRLASFLWFTYIHPPAWLVARRRVWN